MSYFDPDLNKKVLVQDIEQVQQSTQKKRQSRERKEKAEYDAASKEYEKDVQSAEAQYQKDLAEYNRQIAEAERIEKEKTKYDAEIQRLEAAKQKELADAHYSVWGPGGSRNRSELNIKQNTISQNYDRKINQITEQKRVEIGYQEFSIAYPGQILPRNVAETFRSSKSFSLTGLYQTKIESKAAKAEYQRQASAQSAQAIGAKMSAEYHSNIPNIGFISSGLGTERGAAVKDLPNAPEGKKAVKTRPTLINVKTHESIYGGQFIEANPRAFVASLDRQDVDAAGRPKTIQGKEGTQSIFSFENVSNVQDPSAIALLEFQQQLKTKTAPSATIYKGILEERGLPVTPLASRIIDTYSSKGLFRNYKEPTPAKGRKAIISKDGKQLFDMETGIGSVRIGHLLGYKYSKPIMVTELGKDIQGPPEALWAIPDAFGNPRTDASGNPIYLTEESAKKLSERFAEKESDLVIPVIGGEQKLKVTPPKMSELGKEIQRGYKQLDEESILLAKTPKSENPFLAAYQYIAPVGIAAGKSIYAGLAFGVNQAEQVQAPFYSKLLGLKPAKITAPVQVGDASGVTVLPVNFEKLNIRKPETYGPSLQNPLEKEYQQKQSEYIKKYGATEYFSGLVFDYGGLKGSISLIKTGSPKLLSIIAKPALPRIGRMAREAALLGSTGKISSPSRMWDVAEPVQKVGLRIEKKVQPTWAVQKQQLPVPNPFGKERIIPYYLRQRISKVADFGKRVIERPKFATPIWLKNFSDISLNPAHLGTKPNIPTRAQLEKPSEYKRTYPTLGIMRGIFYPDIPTPRSKAPLIPTGFTRINPQTITARQSARQIIKLPSLFKSKISIPKLSSPKFIKRSQQQWQGFVFMQKKRIGEFKESLPSLPKPKANQFVTIQRKIRDVKSGILETKRLSLQLFEWPTAKKQVVPAFGKQELKNLTREDLGIPSNIKFVAKKEPKQLSFGITPTKSPPFMEGFIEKPFRARGKAPIEISFRSDVSGFGSVTQRPQSFFEMRRRFPNAPVEFGIIPKGTGMDALKGPAAEWSKNWMLKQRKVSSQDYLYRLEKIQGKRQWVEYPAPKIEITKYYHGTSKEAAKNILEKGFKPYTGINPITGKPEKIFVTPSKEYAKGFAKWAGEPVTKIKTSPIKRPESEQAVLEIIAKKQKSSNIELDINVKDIYEVKLVDIGLVRSALPSKATRITSERFRQLPKLDPSWPNPPSPVQGDEFMNQLIALRRKGKDETSMLFSDPRRTSKVNVRLIKNEMEGMGYFKTATPFQLKQPKLADWPANWKQLAKAKQPDVVDYLSQKRSFRGFGKTEKERLLKGVGGAGASSYPDVGFGRFGKQKGVPTNLFTLEKATPPVSFPVKRETGMFRLLNINAEEQAKLDIATKQTINKIMKEKKRGELPDITTRSQDTSRTLTGKAKLSFVSEPLRISPIVFQRQRGLFDTRLSIRKGSLVRGLKPVRDARDYLPDRFAETRKAPKGGKPMDLSSWKPKLEIPEPKESSFFFKRERFGKNIIRDDMALPSIRPALIIDKQTFKKITIQYRKGKTDVFFRKFEKSPINSPTKDLSKRTNWDKLASESKKTKEQKDKAWEESQRAPKGGQILVPPEPNPLNLATPEVPIPEAFADVGAKVPFKKDKYKIPLIIPPTPKETKKERPVQTAQTYQEILLSDNRPRISTIQSPRISLAVSQPQKVQESFKINNIQTSRIKIVEMIVTKPRQRERQRPKTIQTPKYETIAITRVTPKLRAAQTPKLASPLAPKAPTKLSAPQRQPLREKPVQITLLRQTPPRRPPRVVFALPPDKEPEKKKGKRESKQVSGIYLGNVPLEQISGIFKRKEITLGKEKIEKTRKGDVRILAGKPRRASRKKQQYDLLGFKKGKATKFF